MKYDLVVELRLVTLSKKSGGKDDTESKLGFTRNHDSLTLEVA